VAQLRSCVHQQQIAQGWGASSEATIKRQYKRMPLLLHGTSYAACGKSHRDPWNICTVGMKSTANASNWGELSLPNILQKKTMVQQGLCYSRISNRSQIRIQPNHSPYCYLSFIKNINLRTLNTLPRMGPAMHLFCSVLHLSSSC